jgi:two-component system response regulator FixJ
MPNNTVVVVDDDADVRDSLQALLKSAGYKARLFDSAKALLDEFRSEEAGCIIADIRMPDMDGLTLQAELTVRKNQLPVIIITGHGDVPLAVKAMKAGALDFIEKPFDDERLLDSVRRALDRTREERNQAAHAQAVTERLAALTPREMDVLKLLIAGHPNKVVAHELSISPRTVEVHRGHLMEKMEARSLSDLVRMALSAGIRGP